MGTRGILVFVGEAQYGGIDGHRLYQHNDSYPTDVLPKIAKGIRAAKRLAAAANKLHKVRRYHPRPIILAALYSGDSVSAYGAVLIEHSEHGMTAPDSPLILGRQTDLEWVYVVNTDTRTVKVFGGGYTGKPPTTFLEVDPTCYADNITDEFVAGVREEIANVVREIRRTGWKIESEVK